MSSVIWATRPRCTTPGAGRAGSSRRPGSRSPRSTAPGPARSRVLVPPTEHHAVLDSVQWLADHEGADADWLPVEPTRLLSPSALQAAIERDPDSVGLVSVMWANNEVGTVQPIAELAQVAREHKIPFHS